MTPDDLRTLGNTVVVTPPEGFTRAARERGRRRSRRAVAQKGAAALAVLAVAATAVVAVRGGEGGDSLQPAQDPVAVTAFPTDEQLRSGRVLYVSQWEDRVAVPAYQFRNDDGQVGTTDAESADRGSLSSWTQRGKAQLHALGDSAPEASALGDDAETSVRFDNRPYTWDDLAQLPTDPQQMKALVFAQTYNDPPLSSTDPLRLGIPLRYLLTLLGGEPLPLAQRQAVVAAIRSFPGLEDQGLVSDDLGRLCHRIYFPGNGIRACFSEDALLLQNELFDRLGQRTLRDTLLVAGLVDSTSDTIPAEVPPPLPATARPAKPFGGI